MGVPLFLHYHLKDHKKTKRCWIFNKNKNISGKVTEKLGLD